MFGSGETKTKPLDWQREPIREAFARNKMATDRMSKAGPWAGANNTGMNDWQKAGLQGSVNFNNGILGSMVPQIQQGATTNNDVAGKVDNWSNDATRAGQGQVAAGQQVSNMGQGMLGYGQQAGDNATKLYTQYSGDVTGKVLSNSERYMNDPTLQASIDAVGRDASKAFGRADLDRAGQDAMAGTANNSRAGIEAATLQGEHERNFSNISASMRSDARNQALQAGRSDYFDGANTAMQANQGVMGSGQFGADLYGLGQRGISGGVDSIGSGANMAGQAGNMRQQSAGMLGQAAQMGQGANQGILNAGQYQQGQDETQRLADEARYYRDNGGFRQDMAQQLYGMAGDQSWGSTTGGGDGGILSKSIGAGLTLGSMAMSLPTSSVGGSMFGSMFGGGAAPVAAAPQWTPSAPPSGFTRGANGMLGQI